MARPKLSDTAAGPTREALEALRDYLADALDQTDSPRDQAALSSRYQSVLEALRDMNRGGASEHADLFGSPPDPMGAPAPGAGS